MDRFRKGYVIQQLQYEVTRENLIVIHSDARWIRLGSNHHSWSRTTQRTTSDVLVSRELSFRVSQYLNQDEVYDAMLDYVTSGDTFHLWAEDIGIDFVLGHEVDDFVFDGEDCFFVRTVINRKYCKGTRLAVNPGEHVFVVNHNDKVIAVDPPCVVYKQEKTT